MEEQKSKKVKLLIAIAILIVLFILFGIFIKSTPESRERKVISYLKKEYKTDFEIVRLIDSGENMLFEGISLDSSPTVCEIKEYGAYYYKYDVLSISDNITFEVTLVDRKFKDTIKEEYFYIKNGDIILNDIAEYIVDVIGEENSDIEFFKSDYTTYGLEGSVRVQTNREIKDVYNKSFIKKLKKISSYIKMKEKIKDDIELQAFIKFKNNIYVWVSYYDDPVVCISDGHIIKEKYSLKEYLERVEK